MTNWASVTPSEHDIQKVMMEWAVGHPKHGTAFFSFAIPNGAKLPYKKNAKGQRFSPQAAKLKAEGLRNGVADIGLMFYGCRMVFVEVKKPEKASKQSPEQVAFELVCRDLGFEYHVVRDFYAFQKLVDDRLRWKWPDILAYFRQTLRFISGVDL
jgi:hypothetical protein